jgi:hypothetical protein
MLVLCKSAEMEYTVFHSFLWEGLIMTMWQKSIAGQVFLAASLLMSSPAHAAVTIASAATQNMSCTSGVCTPTAKKAVLNVGDLTTMLGSGNVTVNTGTGTLAQQVQNIVVSASFNWANASSLTLDAYDSVTVNQPVAVNGTAAVVLTTNDGGASGTLSFGATGSVSFLGTSNVLTINGTPYALANSVATLASAIAANPSGSYALANSYDASADGNYRASPIPTTLTGTVQGLGNTISKLTMKVHGKSGTVGLFTTIGSSGAVENLRLINVHIVGYGDETSGGAMAYINNGLLFGDTVSGSFDSKKDCCSWGGLVGANYDSGIIIQSSADVHIAAYGGGGGLVAYNSGTISLSQASGKFEGSTGIAFAGGLVGENDLGSVDQSFSSVAVSYGASSQVGGLIGLDEGFTSNSYATGTVIGGTSADVGGLEGEASDGGLLSTSYSTGAVSGGTGGIVGGLLGTDGNPLSDCYWDTTTSGTTNGTGFGNKSGLTGLTSQQLQSGLPAGFNPKLWAEDKKINHGFPYLINNPPQ